MSAYLALGTRVWISVTNKVAKGTFSLDTRSSTRSSASPPAGTRLLCACDAGNLQVLRHVWTDTYPRPSSWEESCIVVTDDGGDHPGSAYLGKGRICICGPMSTMEMSKGVFISSSSSL